MPGAGAAGGLGFAFHVFLNGRLTPGIDLILSAIGIDKALAKADVLVTGEGRLGSADRHGQSAGRCGTAC